MQLVVRFDGGPIDRDVSVVLGFSPDQKAAWLESNEEFEDLKDALRTGEIGLGTEQENIEKTCLLADRSTDAEDEQRCVTAFQAALFCGPGSIFMLETPQAHPGGFLSSLYEVVNFLLLYPKFSPFDAVWIECRFVDRPVGKQDKWITVPPGFVPAPITRPGPRDAQ